MPTRPGEVLILSGSGCAGKSELSRRLKWHSDFAVVSVWQMRLQHLKRWEDRDQGDDYEPGCQIAEAACRIYSKRGKSVVLEDIGDAEAVAMLARLQRDNVPARMLSIVADRSLLAERLAGRNCKPSELDWLAELNEAIRARPCVPGEKREEARVWIGQADALAVFAAVPIPF